MIQDVGQKIMYKIVLTILLIVLCYAGQSQTYIVKDSPFIKGTTVVIPGREYKRSGWHNIFWGKHYRKEWNTAFRVKNFYLDTATGGLNPMKEGGGRQSKSLRLEDKNGKEFVLRSVNKDFGKGLKDMDGTFISKIAKDQGSFGHPYTAITITPMAKAVGIYHTVPEIVFVPKQTSLKEFSEEYGDQLYLYEERPDGDQSASDNFGNAKNVIGSEKLMEKTYGDNDNRVDKVAFVRARLFDMVIGDWGRHPDNWRWAEFKNENQTIYKPVPRDRDQAYTKIDGLYPDLAGAVLQQIQGFNKTLKNVGSWNFPGRPLDRKFLNALSLDTWLEQAKQLQHILTDSLIESSIRLMPPELFKISGEEIIHKLKSRRDQLHKYAGDYYYYLSRQVTILGSEKKELIRLNVAGEDEVRVDVYKINKEEKIIDTPFYSRKFSPVETQELFIYGLGGKDIVEVNGKAKSKLHIRVIDPEREDSVVVSAPGNKIKGIKFFKGEKFEYDSLHAKKIKIAVIPVFTPPAYNVFNHDPLDLFPKTGIKVSAGVTFTPQPWRKNKYQVVHSVNALLGFLRTSFNVGYVGRFGHMAGKSDLVLKGRLDAPAVENYFGAGNTSVLANKTRNYYRTFSQRLYGGIGFERNFEKKHHAEVSVVYQSVQYRKSGDHYIGGVAPIDPSVFKQKQFGGIEAGYVYDHSNGSIYPTNGFVFSFSGGALKNLADTGSSFAKLNSFAAIYLPVSRTFTFAMRAGGGTLFGNPDFYHLNKLGGNTELRGYDRERFYGKSVFYTNTEIRWLTNTRNYFFNGKIGLVGFYDIGRVWMPNEKSSLWHDGYGTGLVLIPFNKVTLTAMYGISSEGDNIFFRAEMFF
ncbi:MAG: BamA/TamA family outer membrane protein [Chitinophagaceae bacterium]